MPPEYSLKNYSECIACGGTPFSYFSWTGGQWRPKLFRPFEWHKREFIRSNLLVRLPDEHVFTVPITSGIARRYAKALESDLYCRWVLHFTLLFCSFYNVFSNSYGQFTSSVSSLVCDCAGTDGDCFSAVSSSVVGIGLACSYIANNITSAVATVIVGSNIEVTGNDCLNIRINVVPMSQFAAKEISVLSATAVSAIKSQQRRSVRNLLLCLGYSPTHSWYYFRFCLFVTMKALLWDRS